jgi:hypothetical protein
MGKEGGMKKKKRKLKFGNRVAQMSNYPPVVQKAKEFLDNLPMDEVRTLKQLCAEAGIRHSSVRDYIAMLGDSYRAHCENRSFFSYGNPKTIEAWRRGEYDGEPEEDT